MKIGDRVKVRRSVNGRESWRNAVIVGLIPANDDTPYEGYKVKYELSWDRTADEELEYSYHDVRLYTQLTDDVRDKHEDGEELEKNGLPLVKEILSTILNGAFKKQSEGIKFDEGSIWSSDKSLTIDCVTQDIVGIGSIRETAGYQVTLWHYVPGDRDTPPDVDDEPLGFFTNVERAVECFVHNLAKMEIDAEFQRRADEAYARSLSEDEMPF